MTVSVLDGVPGLGPARRKRLLAELGGIKAVRQAPKEAFEALQLAACARGRRRVGEGPRRRERPEPRRAAP